MPNVRSRWIPRTAMLSVGLMLGSVPLGGLLMPTAAFATSSVASMLTDHYAQSAVERLLDFGVLDEAEMLHFDPEEPIHRAEFNLWLSKTNGTTSTALTDHDEIPRWEAALLVDKAKIGLMGTPEPDDAKMFLDADQIPEAAEAAVGRLFHSGILVGEGDGRFYPDWNLTRGEAAVLLNGLLTYTFAKPHNGLKLGDHEQVILRKSHLDLNHDGKAEETVAVVGTITKPGSQQVDSGYLGVFDQAGNLIGRNDLEYIDILSPQQILVTDLTGDGKNDIVLDSDLHGNGGMGVHNIRVYVQQSDGTFAESKLPDPDWMAQFQPATYDSTAKAWTVAAKDGRTWQINLVGEQWKDFDSSVFTQPFVIAVDPPYSASVANGKLTTRHWAWAGSHVNGLFFLVATYRYQAGHFVVDSFRLEAIPGTVLHEK